VVTPDDGPGQVHEGLRGDCESWLSRLMNMWGLSCVLGSLKRMDLAFIVLRVGVGGGLDWFELVL
jgi:hypothetical protein